MSEVNNTTPCTCDSDDYGSRCECGCIRSSGQSIFAINHCIRHMDMMDFFTVGMGFVMLGLVVSLGVSWMLNLVHLNLNVGPRIFVGLLAFVFCAGILYACLVRKRARTKHKGGQ